MNPNQMQYGLLGLIGLPLMLLTGCLNLGCASLNQQQIDNQVKVMKAWSEFAHENGVMFTGQVSYSGKGGIYVQQLYGVDLGLQAQGTFYFDPTKQTTMAKETK